MRTRTSGQGRANLVIIARLAVDHARRELGQDLGGGSLTDLLLDKLPQLVDVEDARDLLRTMGEPVPSNSAFAVAFDATRDAGATLGRDIGDERSWGEPDLPQDAPAVPSRFYVEPYAHGWSVWDRSTDKNDGLIYPTKDEAQTEADRLAAEHKE